MMGSLRDDISEAFNRVFWIRVIAGFVIGGAPAALIAYGVAEYITAKAVSSMQHTISNTNASMNASLDRTNENLQKAIDRMSDRVSKDIAGIFEINKEILDKIDKANAEVVNIKLESVKFSENIKSINSEIREIKMSVAASEGVIKKMSHSPVLMNAAEWKALYTDKDQWKYWMAVPLDDPLPPK